MKVELTIETGVTGFAVFLQGIFSFLSPCVLPLVPIYLGYLTAGAQQADETGVLRYKKRDVMIHTLSFVIGISFAFFLLGLGFTTLGRFFSTQQTLFARISGVLILLFGLVQLGFFKFSWAERVFRLPINLDKLSMNPFVALLLGFTFSFAWTPCVGPMLASVLVMASSAKTAAVGFFLIGVYTLGFVIPFLAVGLFTQTLLEFFQKHQRVVAYTAKAGGVIMVIIGIMTATGWMNHVTGYLSKFTLQKEENTMSQSQQQSGAGTADHSDTQSSAHASQEDTVRLSAFDFTLEDQFGNTHSMADYSGKVVFLNFWATWCPPCRAEMPDIQALYEKYNENGDDVAIIGVAGPNMGKEGSVQEITSFLSEHEYTYPTLMDTKGTLFTQYGISAFPTTFMITAEGEIFGYVPGAISKVTMEDIIAQTKNANG